MSVDRERTELARTLRLEIDSSTAIEFQLIPAGEFLMGSKGFDSDEEPAHRVRISQDFYLGTYPVTQSQFSAWTRSESYDRWLARAMELKWVQIRQSLFRINCGA